MGYGLRASSDQRSACRLRKGATPSPGYIEMKAAKKLTLLTESNKNDMLIKSLKTAFDNIPWRFEDDEFTPVSSATASWGSPMIDDMIISSLSYPNIPKGQGIPITLTTDEPTGTPRPSLADIRMAMTSSPPIKGTSTPPPPAYTHNPELVSHRRLDHAMDEIRELQGQLQVVKGSNTGFPSRDLRTPKYSLDHPTQRICHNPQPLFAVPSGQLPRFCAFVADRRRIKRDAISKVYTSIAALLTSETSRDASNQHCNRRDTQFKLETILIARRISSNGKSSSDSNTVLQRSRYGALAHKCQTHPSACQAIL